MLILTIFYLIGVAKILILYFGPIKTISPESTCNFDTDSYLHRKVTAKFQRLCLDLIEPLGPFLFYLFIYYTEVQFVLTVTGETFGSYSHVYHLAPVFSYYIHIYL